MIKNTPSECRCSGCNETIQPISELKKNQFRLMLRTEDIKSFERQGGGTNLGKLASLDFWYKCYVSIGFPLLWMVSGYVLISLVCWGLLTFNYVDSILDYSARDMLSNAQSGLLTLVMLIIFYLVITLFMKIEQRKQQFKHVGYCPRCRKLTSI